MTSAPLPQPRHRWYAALYDPMLARMGEKHMGPLRTAVVGGAAGKVLELGSGTGANFAFYDWAKVESLIATEPDPFMLQRASAKIGSVATDPTVRAKVSVMPAPAESLPFDDASFDCIVSTLVFCTVGDPARSISEAYRVLKPGGTFRFIEHIASTGFEATLQRDIQPVYGWTAAGCNLNRYTEDTLRSAGFEVRVASRPRLGPLFPCALGVATKPR
jgi:SAM-dependent methyltransferase